MIPAPQPTNSWIPLAKSPEHNPCGKIYSHHSAKLDKTRTSTLTNSTTMHSVGSVCRLVVISPTVSDRYREMGEAGDKEAKLLGPIPAKRLPRNFSLTMRLSRRVPRGRRQGRLLVPP